MMLKYNIRKYHTDVYNMQVANIKCKIGCLKHSLYCLAVINFFLHICNHLISDTDIRISFIFFIGCFSK